MSNSREEQYNKIKLVGGEMVAAMLAANPGARHSFGLTYIVRQPDGRLKIGYTAKRDLAEGASHRWKNISRKFGDKAYVEPLCTMYGGKTLESLLHYEFRSASVFGEYGEQFHPTDSLLSFALERGHCPVGVTAVKRFEKWKSCTKRS